MFSDLRRLFGALKVEQTPQHISVTGIPADVMQRDIARIWNTSKINTWMFTNRDRSHIEFPLFFAPEIVYALQTIAAHRHGYMANRAIDAILQQLHEHTWLKNTTTPQAPILNWSRVKDISFTLLDHQREFLETYDRAVPAYGLKGFLLSAAPGSGKTVTGLALASCLEADVTFIVCPKNAVYRVWDATIRTNLTHKPKHWVAADDKPYNGEPYLVFHYETLDQAIEIANRLMATGKIVKPVVLLDECHNFNDLNSLRTQLFIKLCLILQSQHVLFASGTPMKAMGYEAIPLMRVIDPYFNDDVEERFRQIFGRNATRALDILKNRMGLVSFKVPKATIQTVTPESFDHQVSMPNAMDYTLDKIREEMRVFIEDRRKHYADSMKQYEQAYYEGLRLHEKTLSSGPERQAYAQYREYIEVIRRRYDPVVHKQEVLYCNRYEEREIMPYLPKAQREAFKHARSVIKYVELKIMGEALGGVLGRKRAKCHVEMVPYMKLEDQVAAAAKKTVIFTSYVEALKAMESHFRRLGYNPSVVFQDTNKNLTQILQQFERDPNVNPLITTYASLSTAVPLVMANVALFTNQPFRDYEKNQAMARVDRIGQDTPVEFHNYYLNTGGLDNISTRSAEILNWSREQVEAIMGKEADSTVDSALESFPLDGYFYSAEEYVEPEVVLFEQLFRQRLQF